MHCREIRRATAIRTSLSRSQRREIGHHELDHDTNIIIIISMNVDKLRIFVTGLAMMLLCVVLVFFLCNILALVVNVLEVILSLAVVILNILTNMLFINEGALIRAPTTYFLPSNPTLPLIAFGTTSVSYSVFCETSLP